MDLMLWRDYLKLIFIIIIQEKRSGLFMQHGSA